MIRPKLQFCRLFSKKDRQVADLLHAKEPAQVLPVRRTLYHRAVFTADELHPFLATALESTNFPELGERYQGKVRDVYRQPKQRRAILIATDRQSAFDIEWCTIPLKGYVLNQISQWWFERTADILPNHVLSVPDPNAMLVKELTMLPLEIVVRAYLTGSTKTSIWHNYQQGNRIFCGHVLPDGLGKNEPLPQPIITPTTKGRHSDDPIDATELITRGLLTKAVWDQVEHTALALFARGQALAAERGVILVDTKYEMGIDDQGTLTLGDELHTPDSSRFWRQSNYLDHLKDGSEPENLDKELFRLWLRKQGFDYGKVNPHVTSSARLDLAATYISLYEMITGLPLALPDSSNIEARLRQNLQPFFL